MRRNPEEDSFNDHVNRTQYWQDLWFCSTDFQEATDRLVHSLASGISRKWMVRCGIPAILQGIVLGTCFQPRTVYFTATGSLKDIGLPSEGNQRKITLYRGVLMGDPLTKVVLHFTNIISRKLGEDLSSGQAFKAFRNSSEAYEVFIANAMKP